jgi:hypothetical protein
LARIATLGATQRELLVGKDAKRFVHTIGPNGKDERTQALGERLFSTEPEQKVEIQFDSRYALRRTS